MTNMSWLGWKVAMRPSKYKAFFRKNILLASTKPPWANIPDNFEHGADHLTSPAMNFRLVILEENTVIFVNFTAESHPNIYNEPK